MFVELISFVLPWNIVKKEKKGDTRFLIFPPEGLIITDANMQCHLCNMNNNSPRSKVTHRGHYELIHLLHKNIMPLITWLTRQVVCVLTSPVEGNGFEFQSDLCFQ